MATPDSTHMPDWTCGVAELFLSRLSSVSLLRGVWGQVGKLSSVCHGHERPPNGKRKLPRAGKNGELNKSNGVSERETLLFLFSLGSFQLPYGLPRASTFISVGSLPGSVYPLFYAPLTATNLSKATTTELQLICILAFSRYNL